METQSSNGYRPRCAEEVRFQPGYDFPDPITSLETNVSFRIHHNEHGVIFVNMIHTEYPRSRCQIQVVVSSRGNDEAYIVFPVEDPSDSIPDDLAQTILYQFVMPHLKKDIIHARRQRIAQN